MLDQDDSGLITVDELKAVFDTQGTKKDESLWVEIMTEVDKNGDNQISFDEFTDVMTNFITRNSITK